jgi:hypothetical protein
MQKAEATLGRLDTGHYYDLSKLKVSPHKEQPKQDIPSDISGITDPKELFRIAKARGLL